MNDHPAHVAIIGAGFSGTMLAVHLLRRDHGPRVTLIERRERQFARGVAYGTPHPTQLLNVRAAGMSALPDEPDHFTHWLAKRNGGAAASFVPRAVYGEYLGETLAAVDGDRLARMSGEVEAITERSDGLRLDLGDGRTITADAAVLAIGNLPPLPPPGIVPAALTADSYVNDPWASDPTTGLDDGDTVVLIGTGLTAVDVALQFEAAGFGGRILALSRRGLAPRPHVDGAAPVVQREAAPAATPAALVAAVRRDAAATDWRSAVDSLRGVTQQLWRDADAATRRRFLRHLRPYWDVHRHRIAPAVAAAIDALVAAGTLRFAAGRIEAAEPEDDGVALRWRPRGSDESVVTHARRIVNCTGPQGDLIRSTDPLLGGLLAAGIIRPDAMRLGIDVDAASRVIGAGGSPDDRLYCIGPMTRGALWEIVAVPDIRHQVAALADRLAGPA